MESVGKERGRRGVEKKTFANVKSTAAGSVSLPLWYPGATLSSPPFQDLG